MSVEPILEAEVEHVGTQEVNNFGVHGEIGFQGEEVRRRRAGRKGAGAGTKLGGRER